MTASDEMGDMGREAAAERLGVSASTLDRLIRTGVLTAYRIRRRVLVDRSSVERYREACRVTPFAASR